uniref:Lipase n=1 Tax=Panagrolaimus sp. JU765 TaxID=591449 RepID=A0AC34R828_9BILA
MMMFSVFVLAVFLSCVSSQDDPQGPLTQDFQNFLNQNGYKDYDFVRADLGNSGSYGGKSSPSDKINRQPVIFIHGNSDAALSYSSTSSGWSRNIAYFLSKGHKTAELYATTWGDANPLNAVTRTHDCTILPRIRKFVEAVIAYTNASHVDIISHSMGVTIGRKVIKGGTIQTSSGKCDLGPPLAGKVDTHVDIISHSMGVTIGRKVIKGGTIQISSGKCDLGPPLAGKVETFVGLSGGNYGLCNCEGGSALVSATCNQDNGFWPGDSCGFNTLDCGLSPLPFPCDSVIYSTFLTALNADTTKEGSYVYSAWSLADDVILYADQVWGRPTSLIPTSNGKKVYNTYTHMETKELTADDQYDMVVHHAV